MSRMGIGVVFVAAVGFLFPTGAPRAVLPAESEEASRSKETYEVVVKKNVPIPMRDGLSLVADVYFPAQNGAVLEGKHGTLLQRSPYNKEGGGSVR
ncbi:MAG: hypothetical protein ACRD3V_33435, partial [Vicinamibacteria bacterium]